MSSFSKLGLFNDQLDPFLQQNPAPTWVYFIFLSFLFFSFFFFFFFNFHLFFFSFFFFFFFFFFFHSQYSIFFSFIKKRQVTSKLLQVNENSSRLQFFNALKSKLPTVDDKKISHILTSMER